MSKIVLFVILALHLVPEFFIEEIKYELRELTYDITILCIILIQATFIFVNVKGWFTKILAFATLVVSLWSLFDYMAISSIEMRGLSWEIE